MVPLLTPNPLHLSTLLAKMSSEIQAANTYPHEKNDVQHVGDVKTEANFRQDAMEAESAEFNMTVMEAVKAYPMACFWSFIMSSTIIVSSLSTCWRRC